MASTTIETSFHPFTRLPKELRLEIWRSSLPGPRLIRLFIDKNNNLVSNATPPIGLQICQESRIETLRFYKRRFAVDSSNARIYINTEYDALQLPSPSSFVVDGQLEVEGLVTFWTLFKMATTDIRNDIKAACVDNAWFQTIVLASLQTDAGQPLFPPPFGPDCRLFLFQGKWELLPFRHTVWSAIPKNFSGLDRVSQPIFGTSKITSIIHEESPTNRAHKTIVPRIPLSDQDWTTNFDGFGSVVRQYIETTLLKSEGSVIR
ncbi:hypothetical protein EYC80_007140 [Monilinia laxa]|uniref:2EXR domain-containing protein n=1 Tax=Monilinia laxa TaxID=61186 RepID=A0A5N6K0N9_MONLA|nr:hypothetical protein EYC80_007140 [Monilinia laxa]